MREFDWWVKVEKAAGRKGCTDDAVNSNLLEQNASAAKRQVKSWSAAMYVLRSFYAVRIFIL